MPTIAELAAEYAQEDRPTGIIIDDAQVVRQLIAAARLYAAYGALQHGTDPVPTFDDITEDTELSLGEWGMIRPLFVLYVERETAVQLEASRALGVEVFGRTVSEIDGEITQYESMLPEKAFCQPVITV